MEYYKLIALSVGDLSSSIFYEDNYGLNELDDAKLLKGELELKGYTCLLAKVRAGMKLS